MADGRRGFLLGVAAYALWGLFPLYWPLLEPAGAVEILGHRIAWSALTMLLLVLLLRRRGTLVGLWRDRRKALLLVLAGFVITVNWGVYIYGVNNERVVEASLGYFINPLVTVLMGVLILGERLRPLQWAALTLASVAVVVLTVDYGRPPYVALALAFSFGTYGLLKKTAGAPAVESLTLETLVLAPFALTFLIWLGTTGESHVTGYGTGHVLLLASTGIVTAIPLICFGAAATRVSMTTLGLLQYIAPVVQFVIGVTIRAEEMSPVRWAGFALVWVALVIFTLESLAHHRRSLALAAAASAA